MRRNICILFRRVFVLLVVFFVSLGFPPVSGPWWPAPPPVVRAQSEPYIRDFTLGMSGQGRPISVTQVGRGPRKLVVVGNTHGGAEANTYTLASQLVAHFRAHPDEVPPAVRLYLIPTINPDGLALGTRFNAAKVDLNRNMNTNLDSCLANDWSQSVYGAYGMVSSTGGSYPDSEVESRLIRSFLLDASGAIFLHSNAGLVFPAFCEHPPSIGMAQTYAEAAGYRYERYWEAYTITGSMADWASSIGITAITPELITATDPEFARNLVGVQAVMAHAEELLPLPQDQQVGSFVVPARIWRYWRTHGGEAVFGPPLEAAIPSRSGLSQTFANARLEIHDPHADTPYLVQPALLGSQLWPEPPPPTPPALSGAFLDYWERNGGVAVYGYPVSAEHLAIAADGQLRPLQYFERTALAYYAEDGSVRPEPLGWQTLLQEQARAAWVVPQIR